MSNLSVSVVQRDSTSIAAIPQRHHVLNLRALPTHRSRTRGVERYGAKAALRVLRKDNDLAHTARGASINGRRRRIALRGKPSADH
jgi:hypothetical protein